MEPRTNDPHPSTTTHTPDPRATHRGRRRRRPGRRPGPMARLRTVVGAVLALALATVTLVLVPGAAPAGAGDEWATEVTLGYNDDALPGQKDFGDLPMPDCGSKNITGHFRLAKWVIRSSRAPGIVTVGDEWDLEVRMQSAWSAPPYQNDGPDPLTLWLGATGPVERVGPVEGTYGDAGLLPYDAHFGPSPTGTVGSVGEFGYEYDANSSPGWMDGSDGVNLTMRYRLRATAAGSVSVDALDLHGTDATPPAGDVACSVPLGWNWTVLPAQDVTVQGESAKVDARYFGSNPGDRNGGDHEIDIDVLANDDDPNIAGGPGSTDQVRLVSWPVHTAQGGTLDCGPLEPWEIDPATTDWEDLPAGPCRYSPPQDHSGADSFTYDVVQKTGRKVKTATVSITVLKNDRPIVLPAQFAVDQNTDKDFSLQGVVGDVNGDPLACLPGLIEPVAPAVGAVSLAADCTFHWDNQDPGFTGNVTFGFRACDTHATARGKGSLGPAVTPAADYHLGWPDDLDASHTRRCEDGTATVTVTQGGVFPPVGVMDVDVVDAGYAGDGVGPYTVDLDVLANDWDPNGPVDAGSVTLGILDGPDPAEGTASVVAGRIRFTPTDGFSGPVSFTYRLCEDPALQAPPYEGLPYCGVGGVSLDVVGNEAPVVGGLAVEATDGDVVALDLGVLAFDPENEGLECTDLTLPGPDVVDAWQWTGPCQVEIDLAAGQHGTTPQFAFTVCDQHLLALPAQPSAPYGADGRQPGDLAPRCSEGTIDVTIPGDDAPDPQDPQPEDPQPEDPQPEDPQPEDPQPEDPADPQPGDPGNPQPEDPGDGQDGDGQGGDGTTSDTGSGTGTGTGTGSGSGSGTAGTPGPGAEADTGTPGAGSTGRPLPRTGFPIALPLTLGLGLLVAGGGLLSARRRLA